MGAKLRNKHTFRPWIRTLSTRERSYVILLFKNFFYISNSLHECIVIFCNFILSSPLFIRLQNVLIFLFCIEIFYPRNLMELRYKIFYFSTMMILFLLLYSFDYRTSFYFAILRKKKFNYSTHKHIYIYTRIQGDRNVCTLHGNWITVKLLARHSIRMGY